MKLSMNSLVRNLLTTRQSWLKSLFDSRRDIDAECGHPDDIQTGDYAKMFRRRDIASRIIRLYPEECWSQNPEVFETEDETETEFERAWIDLQKQRNIYAYLHRIDVLSGIGRFGILLLGFDDGKDLREPLEGFSETGEVIGKPDHHLLYLRPFDETLVSVKSLQTDISNPRYGLPQLYEVQFADSILGVPSSANNATTQSKIVHWSRILHVADNRTSSDVWGDPRLEVVFDRVLDIRKIVGGSGEMFWKGGFPGFSLEATPEPGEDIVFDVEATKEQMDAYMNGLQRYIALTGGMTAKSLTPQVSDPGPHLESQIRLIAIALGVPWRILMGVEVGQLASQQDIKSWNRRLSRRREEYLTPFLISPFIQRLIDAGALPELGEEGFTVEWSDLDTPSDKDRAEVAEKKTNALAKYVQSGADIVIPPFQFLTLVLDFTDEEATSIIEAAGDRLLELEDEDEVEGSAPQPARRDNGR